MLWRRRARAEPAARADETFVVGDRVLVSGGYESPAEWLAGSEGYRGTLVAIDGPAAVVELDAVVTLSNGTWQDFGGGSQAAVGTVQVAEGRWLVLLQGWVGASWTSPTGKLHVGLCPDPPRLADLPPGGGIGIWVESHATMTK